MDISITSTEGNAARGGGADAEHATVAARGDSRLVIRDEREPTGEAHTRDESVVNDPFPDFEAEIYRFEARGERAELIAHPVPLEGANPAVAHIDWCALSVRGPGEYAFAWISSELKQLGGFASFSQRSAGLNGYSESAVIEDGGLLAWGGKNQRGTVYVSLNAVGCGRIQSWAAVHDWCVRHQARLTRVDAAHDDLLGGSMTIEKAHEYWLRKGFNAGGRRPATQLAGDWWDLAQGRTVYIGKRLNGKLLRIYEKGKQLGDPASPWVRIELELHNKDRVIPHDMLLKPGAYLAGAYPCLNYLSTEQCKVKTTRNAAAISLKRAVEIARQQYGKLFNFVLDAFEGDYAPVVELLKRDGMPGRMEQYSEQLKHNPHLLEHLRQEVLREAPHAA